MQNKKITKRELYKKRKRRKKIIKRTCISILVIVAVAIVIKEEVYKKERIVDKKVITTNSEKDPNTDDQNNIVKNENKDKPNYESEDDVIKVEPHKPKKEEEAEQPLELAEETEGLNEEPINENGENENTEPEPPTGDVIIPNSNIIYDAEEYAVDMHDVKAMIDGTYAGDEKWAFLTFDDGPTYNTNKVLDILDQKDVHATFFVYGSNLEEIASQEALKRTIYEGNAIGNHTFSHSYSALYPNNQVDTNKFLEEFDSNNNRMKEILGDDFSTNVLRMPGGHSTRSYYNDPNLPLFDQALLDRGIVNIDWDALNGDADGKQYTVDQLVDNVKNTVRSKSQTVVLMHDTYGKDSTVEALPQIIDYLKANNYQFKVIKST